MNPNLEFLNSFLQISEITYRKLERISVIRKFEAGIQLSKPGEAPSKIYLLVSGIMRAYLSSETGKEFNKAFFMPFSLVGPLTALIKKEPSKLAYETLTECKVHEVNYEDFMNLCKRDIKISNLYNKIMEDVFIKYEERQLELISMDATERYLKLQDTVPEIDELIPQYHIASYLSITPVQLSRIRRNLKKEN